MIAQSQSGTGKTAAFALAVLSRVDVKNQFPQVNKLYQCILLHLCISICMHLGFHEGFTPPPTKNVKVSATAVL